MRNVVGFVLFTCGLWAQTQPPAQGETAAPITSKDLENLRLEVQKAKEAADKAARVQSNAARAAEKQSIGIRNSLSKLDGAQSNIQKSVAVISDAQRRLAKEAEDRNRELAAERARAKGNFLLTELALSGLVIFLVGTLIFLFRKSMKRPAANNDPRLRPGEARRILGSSTPDAPAQDELLENPFPDQITDYAAKHPMVASFDVFYTDPVKGSRGPRIKGTVFRIDDGELRVNWPGYYPDTLPSKIGTAYKTAIYLLSHGQPAKEMTKN